jgi:hypothetical protein
MPDEWSNMDAAGLYPRLIEAYSDANLNRITGKLIEWHRTKDFSSIRNLAGKISGFVSFETETDARCFSGLIRLYHPDRGQSIRNALTGYFNSGNKEKLHMYSHIFLIENFEGIPAAGDREDIGYDPGYGWDDAHEGFRYFHKSEASERQSEEDVLDTGHERTFYDAVKVRMYGNPEIEFPAHYLEDFEEIEFADSQIDLLDGIEHCRHAISLDLSSNNITDISDLWNLERLEELYLADNQIGYIDALCNLTRLRVLDISGNEIDDLTPLFGLEKLEYLNLIGNKIPSDQIIQLKAKGIIVTD